MENVITVESIDTNMAKYETEFQKGNEALTKLRESKANVDAQISQTIAQMQRIRGAWAGLSELKADITGTEPEELPEDTKPKLSSETSTAENNDD